MLVGRRTHPIVKTKGHRATPERQFSLPDLTGFDGDRLEARHDYDAIDFVDRDFTGQDASDARFMECRLEGCCLDGLSMRRARFRGFPVADVMGERRTLATRRGATRACPEVVWVC